MNRVAPESLAPDEPITETQNVAIPTDDQSTDRGGASAPDSAHRSAWPPNEAPPPYSELHGNQDQFSEHSFELPPPYESAAPSMDGDRITHDRLRAPPETTLRGANAPSRSHHDDESNRISSSCLVVWCIFCPFLFIAGFLLFAITMCVGVCAEKCCGHEEDECTGNCRRHWERFCP